MPNPEGYSGTDSEGGSTGTGDGFSKVNRTVTPAVAVTPTCRPRPRVLQRPARRRDSYSPVCLAVDDWLIAGVDQRGSGDSESGEEESVYSPEVSTTDDPGHETSAQIRNVDPSVVVVGPAGALNDGENIALEDCGGGDNNVGMEIDRDELTPNTCRDLRVP
ncbi:hypothetical protein Purlil1_12778 [Purpureocillium lilacinum]|uniref:Uncharacterized protein n=1 Tax=Purpureocillium lilacinum TaxID=33203 RepID=A0ABR0BFX7_PURLI|nr:hypothetical protein Purlil1_12778 [Purpureocillium lilacinum]